jgi:hypothetical protein
MIEAPWCKTRELDAEVSDLAGEPKARLRAPVWGASVIAFTIWAVRNSSSEPKFSPPLRMGGNRTMHCSGSATQLVSNWFSSGRQKP